MVCPLCGSSSSRIRASIRLVDLLEDIDAAYGTRLVATATHAEASVLLRSCRRCSLEFFDPMIAGDSAFYTELGAAEQYYTTGLRWDQRRTLELLGSASQVIDVGAGDGLFLEALRDRGVGAIGIDFREGASEWNEKTDDCANQVVRFAVDLNDPAERTAAAVRFGGSADWVTAFHVLEHLTEPVAFVRFLRDLVGGCGSLAVSVPNRHRFDPAASQPLDCPPHHLTRWSKKNLEILGRSVGAATCQVYVERDYDRRRMFMGSARWAIDRLQLRSTVDTLVGAPWPPWRVVNGLSLLAVYHFDCA